MLRVNEDCVLGCTSVAVVGDAMGELLAQQAKLEVAVKECVGDVNQWLTVQTARLWWNYMTL